MGQADDHAPVGDWAGRRGAFALRRARRGKVDRFEPGYFGDATQLRRHSAGVFTSDARKMGRFTNPVWLQTLAWLVTLIIVGLNGYLLVQMGSQFFAK